MVVTSVGLYRGRMTRKRAVIRGLLLPEGPRGPVQDSRLPGVILHRGMIPGLIPGSSAGVQGRCLPVVVRSRKTKLLPDSRLHQQMPCDPPTPSASVSPSAIASALVWAVAQSHDVWGETVFKKDPSVPLAVQFYYKAIPVDDQTRAKPANKEISSELHAIRNCCFKRKNSK